MITKDEILGELNYDTVSFRDGDGDWFEGIDSKDFDDTANRLVKLFAIHNVSKSIAKQYAEFCVRCDREGLPLLELDDYIKQYWC